MRTLHLAGGVHFLDELAEFFGLSIGGGDHGLGLAVGFVVAKASLGSSLFARLPALLNFANFLAKFVGALAPPISDPRLDRLTDRHALRNREIFAHFVLGKLAADDLVHTDDADRNLCPAEQLGGLNTTLASDQHLVNGDHDAIGVGSLMKAGPPMINRRLS